MGQGEIKRELRDFGERKRCVSCGMKHMDIRKKAYKEQKPDYWRVSVENYNEDFGILEPCLENCILHLPALNFENVLMSICEPWMSPDPGMLTVAMTRVRWFEAVHFTTPLTMEYLANFKPPKHVLQEDIRLE
jgi:hypothetical protein